MPSPDQYDTGTGRESMGRILGCALQMSGHGVCRSTTLKAGTSIIMLNNERLHNPR